MSRRGWAFLKTLIFTIFVPGLFTVGLPYVLLPPRSGFRPGRLWLIGLLSVVLGAFCYFWCAWDFVFVGQGTPAPADPPGALVVRGLYREARNPMYVSVMFILVGEAVLFESWKLLGCAVVFGLAAHLFVVFYEEPTLKKKFGAAYDEYCKTVPRWVPRFTSSKGAR